MQDAAERKNVEISSAGEVKRTFTFKEKLAAGLHYTSSMA